MKVFVTGGTGFIGKYLVEKLAKRGDDVVCLTRNLSTANLPAYNNVEFVEGDILNPESYEKFLKGLDVVYYLAAFVDHDPSKKNLSYDINVKALKTFFELAEKNNVPRVVYLSSAAVYHPTRDGIPDEYSEFPKKFINHYSYTKYLGYLEVQKSIKRGLNIISILPTSIYGPGSPLFFDLMDFLYKKRIFFKNFLNNKLSLAEVNDVVSAILLAQEKSKPKESYIVSGETVSMERFISEMEKYFKIKIKKIFIPNFLISLVFFMAGFFGKILNRKFYPNTETLSFLNGNLVASDKKIINELGYKGVSLETGLRKMFDSFSEFI